MKRLVLLLLISMPVQADIYKCSTPTGDTVFQQVPCGSLKSEPYTPTPSSVIGGASEYGRDNSDSNSNRYNSAPSQAYERYEQRVEERDERWCQLHQDRLASAQERWETQRRQGYTQRDRDYHEQRIRDAERAVMRNCN